MASNESRTNRVTWEYLAGFTDGEASFCFQKYPSTIGAVSRIQWPQKNVEVLEAISDFLLEYGLTPRLYTYSRDLSCLVLNRQEEVWFVLDQMVEHLIVKRDQAVKVILALEARLTERGVFGGV